MADNFTRRPAGLSDPGPDIIPITPDDDNDLVTGVRALRAKTAGSIHVTMYGVDGVNVERTLDFAAAETRVGMFVRVWATGTTVETATDGTGIEGHI